MDFDETPAYQLHKKQIEQYFAEQESIQQEITSCHRESPLLQESG